LYAMIQKKDDSKNQILYELLTRNI